MQFKQWLRFDAAYMTAVVLATASGTADAQQSYPIKPVRLLVATTAGSQPDALARMIAQKLSERWGRPVIVENRPGAGGALAAGTVAKSAPDGYTLLYTLPNFTISAVLQPSLPYDTHRDFAGVSQIGYGTNVLVVAPVLGVKTVKDLIALARAQPGKIIFGSGATGTAGHLSGVRFGVAAGLKIVHVAFKGGPEATIEVLAGRTHYNVATLGVALPFISDAKLLALGVTTPQRTPILPDMPALAETLSEFKQPETSHGLLAPAGTPRPLLNQINKELARILELSEVRERLQSISFVTAPNSPDEYDTLLRAQIETLHRLVREAGLRPK